MLDKLIYEGKPFFNNDTVLIEIIKSVKQIEHHSKDSQRLYPGTRTDIINGVFESLSNVDEFMMIIGRSVENAGLLALVFREEDLSQHDFEQFETMVYYTVPLNVFLRCFVFDIDDFKEFYCKGIEEQQKLN